ncbi:MAG TPA: glycogen debranching protein GlgX [Sphingobium sp.]
MELGARLTERGAIFAVRAPRAEAVTLCLFDGKEERRHAMARRGDDWCGEVHGVVAGQRYGYRAEGEWAPERGHWFDPAKLLVDPYATAVDQRFGWHPALNQYGVETATLVPWSVLEATLPDVERAAPVFTRGGLIYEINVRGFTMLHPDIAPEQRGTVAALAHPAIISHLQKLRVTAVELMPIVAWIDERHLPPLGLSNAWGYNPVVPMPLDPQLCPGGMAELRATVAALHAAGIGVILDLVFNHTGESDDHGPILSLRGLDDAAYAREPDGRLINDTGTGNTLDFSQKPVRDLILASLRHFVRHAGIDGYRFDLAPVLARGPAFDPAAPIFAAIADDAWLADRVLIAEPWDLGPGGYRLGKFPDNWLEWNDIFRDDVRRFWRGDGGIGSLVTRLCGSSDILGKPSRTVNFLAAHDGFTLADTVAYEAKHNEANGEGNRDGHNENCSWNNGIEGPSDDPVVTAARAGDLRALLATLFASTGTIMLTAGDEFGRSQRGNNNAYAQDNEIGWVAWAGRDTALEDFVSRLSNARAEALAAFVQFPEPGVWTRLDGAPMTVADWESPECEVVTYESVLGDGKRFRLKVDRNAKSVFVDIGSE